MAALGRGMRSSTRGTGSGEDTSEDEDAFEVVVYLQGAASKARQKDVSHFPFIIPDMDGWRVRINVTMDDTHEDLLTRIRVAVLRLVRNKTHDEDKREIKALGWSVVTTNNPARGGRRSEVTPATRGTRGGGRRRRRRRRRRAVGRRRGSRRRAGR